MAEELEEVKWYVLHTQPGHENQAMENLKMVFEKNKLSHRLVEIAIPTRDEVEETESGKTKVVERKVCPSYIFIKMSYNNNMWHIITSTRGITGFVGPNGYPLALTYEEAVKIGIETPVAKGDYNVGDTVKVIRGPLDGFVGTIEKVDTLNKKLKVNVMMFGRATPVDLDFTNVEPFSEGN